MPAGPMTLTSRGPLLAPGGVEQVLEQAELVVAADERRLEASRMRLRPPALGDDPQRAPGGDRAGLALEHLLAGRLERDRLLGRALGRLADEDGAGRRDGLQPARGVDEVAGDHALVRGAERDRRLAGQDAGARLDRRARASRTASTRSRPARTARSASSSWATGAPHTAMTASPMNFSTVPP